VPPRVENDLSGTVSGNSVQAGSISGGVHFYVAESAGVSSAVPQKKRTSTVARVWRIFWGWVVLLVLLFLISGLLSYVINISIGRGSWVMNLAVDLFLLCAAVLVLAAAWKRIAVQPVSFLVHVGSSVDRCTPACVKETSTPTLYIVGVLDGFFLLATFAIQEEVRASRPRRARMVF
jgi:hypothetical protein